MNKSPMQLPFLFSHIINQSKFFLVLYVCLFFQHYIHIIDFYYHLFQFSNLTITENEGLLYDEVPNNSIGLYTKHTRHCIYKVLSVYLVVKKAFASDKSFRNITDRATSFQTVKRVIVTSNI